MTVTNYGRPIPRAALEPAPAEKQRLAPEAYAALCKTCPMIAVNNDTGTLQAGFQLGVQHVLQKLREGFVVGL